MTGRRHELVPVLVTNSLMEAEELRCLLEGSGLTPFVFDEHLPRMVPTLGAPLGGVRVLVPDDQLERAAEVLRDAGRLDGGLPLTGKGLHPYAAPARGSRAFAVGMLLVAAVGAIFWALDLLIRASGR